MADQNPNPIPTQKFCGSCLNGWWCRGCGGQSKKLALIKAGLTQEQVDDIYYSQFGDCCAPYVPCFICKQDGHIPNNGGDKTFWR